MNVITHRLDPPRKNPRDRVITGRRKEVLHWLARGKTNEEIGRIMGLSPLTLKNHVRDILIIYNAPNRLSAVMRAMARGDLSIDELVREFA
jgi:DNA-binding CsgD family transcriptional regulator